MFDLAEPGYEGPLYAEVSPRSFSVRVRKGSRLNQLRFRRRDAPAVAPERFRARRRELARAARARAIVDGELNLRDGVVASRRSLEASARRRHRLSRAESTPTSSTWIASAPTSRRILGRDAGAPDRRLILDPGEFYILASQERVHIPADLAAEMVAIDPAIGEFRVHYAGFFDPGFGAGAHRRAGQPRRAGGAQP